MRIRARPLDNSEGFHCFPEEMYRDAEDPNLLEYIEVFRLQSRPGDQ